MKQRVITAVVGIPLLFLVLIVAPKVTAAILYGLLMAVGTYEVLFVTGLVRHPRMVLYACMMSIAVSLWSYYDAERSVALIILMVFWLLEFGELMGDHVHVKIEMVCCCLFAGAVVPYLLTSVIRLLTMTTGRYMVIVPFVVAFCSDAGAYLIGVRIGRHKLAPVVSPNKTVEGLVGGILCAIVGMLIYAVLLALVFHQNVNFGAALLYGVLGSAAGVFGDLCFSVIKRQSAIKDYGNLLPGHGGFYDRFDSMVLVAPVIEAMVLLMPLVG